MIHRMKNLLEFALTSHPSRPPSPPTAFAATPSPSPERECMSATPWQEAKPFFAARARSEPRATHLGADLSQIFVKDLPFFAASSI